MSGAPTPSEIMTAAAFRNALVVMQAIGGSTNGAHPSHRRGRAARPSKIDLDEVDRLGREVPVLVDLKPSGQHYMEHFHWAGGVPRLLRELGDLLDLDAPTVDGRDAARRLAEASTIVHGAGRDPRRARRRSTPAAAWPCCAATSRRAARSSSSRRRSPR